MSFYDAKQIIWAKLSASELRLVEINIRSYPVDFTAILITSHTVKVTNLGEVTPCKRLILDIFTTTFNDKG